MAQAPRDQNKVPVWLATSNADGVTTIAVTATASTNALLVKNGTGGSDLSDAPAKRDGNKVVALMAVSSADGTTPVPVYADSATGGLLVDST